MDICGERRALHLTAEIAACQTVTRRLSVPPNLDSRGFFLTFMTKRNADDETLSAVAAREYSQGETAPHAAKAPAEIAVNARGEVETNAHGGNKIGATETDALDTEEWDDTPTALGLRAIFTFLSGAFLIYSMTRAPLSSFDAARLAQSYLLALLILPLGIVWLFFAQSVRHVSYLKNQALNAWNYGWNFRIARAENAPSFITRILASPLWSGIALCVVVVPLLLFAARGDDGSAAASTLFPLNASTRAWWFPLAILIAFCREGFFRGFLLFGIAQGFRGLAAPIVAIVVQAALFAAALGQSSGGAFFGASNVALFAAGILMGAVAWQQKSFVAPFISHSIALLAAYLLMR